jgi:phosphoribosylanthranilate isomerase
MKVKICGITNSEDALYAAGCGADALGFIFYPDSPRCITPDRAASIISQLPPFITTVGVFVDEDPDRITETMNITGIKTVQLHGSESPDTCGLWPSVIKAFRIREMSDLNLLRQYPCASAYLLDTYSEKELGGTGRVFNWDIAAEAKKLGRIIVAGGLTPDNVAEAVRHAGPYAVDVAGGVEAAKGKKDFKKVREFIERAKEAAA